MHEGSYIYGVQVLSASQVLHPATKIEIVRCSCGWEVEVGSRGLTEAKALLAQHQQGSMGLSTN